MYVSNDYYIETSFIDSRVLAWKSSEYAANLIQVWEEHNITHVYINDLYPLWPSASVPEDVLLIRSPAFQQKHLQAEFTDGQQHVYRILYDKA